MANVVVKPLDEVYKMYEANGQTVEFWDQLSRAIKQYQKTGVAKGALIGSVIAAGVSAAIYVGYVVVENKKKKTR